MKSYPIPLCNVYYKQEKGCCGCMRIDELPLTLVYVLVLENPKRPRGAISDHG